MLFRLYFPDRLKSVVVWSDNPLRKKLIPFGVKLTVYPRNFLFFLMRPLLIVDAMLGVVEERLQASVFQPMVYVHLVVSELLQLVGLVEQFT